MNNVHKYMKNGQYEVFIIVLSFLVFWMTKLWNILQQNSVVYLSSDFFNNKGAETEWSW